jgi:hypothetical protein
MHSRVQLNYCFYTMQLDDDVMCRAWHGHKRIATAGDARLIFWGCEGAGRSSQLIRTCAS